MFSEDDLLPVSALSHLVFCERRAALLFIENIWEDNVMTIEGNQLHEKVDEQETESRGDIRIARGLRLRSLQLGLSGITDVVEFHKVSVNSEQLPVISGIQEAIPLSGVSGLWKPYIVEYKRGRLRHEKSFEVQLCAQAICLEEMLNVHVLKGAVFYGKPRRRLDVEISTCLRLETEMAAARLHNLFNSGKTPQAVYEKKCDSCSLMPVCMPKSISNKRKVDKYIKDHIQT